MVEPAVTADGTPRQSAIPELNDPPIEEVVCGFVFEPVAELDTLEHGIYWQEVASRYPKKALMPALAEKWSVFQGVAPIRSWLIAEAEDFLLQIQADRFYVNWRRRSGNYPRFRDRGSEQGLCSRALHEFEAFSEFVGRRLNVPLVPKRIELHKQDVLSRPKHWSNWNDLAAMLPVLDSLSQISRDQRFGLNLRMEEKQDRDAVALQIVTRLQAEEPVAVQLDFQYSSILEQEEANIEAAFYAANERLNVMFAGLLAPSAWERFRGDGA